MFHQEVSSLLKSLLIIIQDPWGLMEKNLLPYIFNRCVKHGDNINPFLFTMFMYNHKVCKRQTAQRMELGCEWNVIHTRNYSKLCWGGRRNHEEKGWPSRPLRVKSIAKMKRWWRRTVKKCGFGNCWQLWLL